MFTGRTYGVLLSSIDMLWAKPAIIGVISPTIPNSGHAVRIYNSIAEAFGCLSAETILAADIASAWPRNQKVK
jgi:hypothetical protein